MSNLTERLEGDNIQIQWLEGEVPTQLNDQPVSISGTITAPRVFLEGRDGEFYKKTAHALVSETDGTIKLVVNEHRKDEKYTISGSIALGKIFQSLGINTEKSYAPADLSKKLRLMRAIFKNSQEHMNLVALLKNFKAKVNQDMEKADDNRGNVKLHFSQVVDSNVPSDFTITLPLIEGENPEEIKVAVIMQCEGANQINCYLESVDAAEIIDNKRAKMVQAEVKEIVKHVIVINQ